MSTQTKEKLLKFRHNFFREKYRFDQGNAFLVFLNFSLLVISLVKQSDGNSNMIPYYVLLGFVGTWILGFFLDKVVKVQEASERVVLNRSPIWKENFDHHDNLDQKMELIHKKLDRLESMITSNMNTVNELKEERALEERRDYQMLEDFS